MKKINFNIYLKQRLKKKSILVTMIIYTLLCIVAAIGCCFKFNLRNFLLSLSFSFLVPLIFCIEYILKFKCGELFLVGILTLAYGSILGTCFNFYSIIPFLDTILHGLSGFLFCSFGFTLAVLFFGKEYKTKRFFGCLVFAICFSLAIAVVWEIFEYGCTTFFGYDMMEDTYVTNINSYLLANSHTECVEINGIIQTIIYYGDNQIYTINGYLDLGLIDTLTDMIICLVGTILFAMLSILSYFKFPKLNEKLISKPLNNSNN